MPSRKQAKAEKSSVPTPIDNSAVPPLLAESTIYDFVPDGWVSQGERYIMLDTDETGTVVLLSSPDTQSANLPTPKLQAKSQWAKLASEIIPNCLDALVATLKEDSVLPSLVTAQLFEHLLKVYKHKLETTIQTEGLDAIDTNLSHFKLVTDRKTNGRKLELVLNDEKIKAYLLNSLHAFFDQSGIWQDFAKTVGANLLIWVADTVGNEAIATAAEHTSKEQLLQALQQQLGHLYTSPLKERLEFLEHIYCQDITKRIVESFNLPDCSLQDLEKLLGLKPKPPTSSKLSVQLEPIGVIPTSIPIASSIRAQLRPDLWQQDPNQKAVFLYRSKNNPHNFIEHYITNPGDIAILPWEAAEQIINKFGFDTVKLQLIFAARTMDEEEPWKSTFTLRASDIIHLLGWDKNHSTSLPEKRNAVASAAYALSCLLVKSVWVEGQTKRKVDASTPIGRMWDMLIDPHGQFDWVTGKIEKPDEIYITVSPGLWTKHFLNRAGSKAREALHQFGYLAKDILKIDPYHNELALRLAIQLTLDARIRVHNQNPYDYRVTNLLEEVLAKAQIEQALEDKHKARDLKNRWNSALDLLMNLGWQIEFDPETYPAWLQPRGNGPKPPDWRKIKVIERLLQAKLTIKPPQPIPELLAKVKEPKRLKVPDAPTAIELTGQHIAQAREQRGWSRKELGGFLNLSADYIGKLERGDRVITPELEAKLRRLLHID